MVPSGEALTGFPFTLWFGTVNVCDIVLRLEVSVHISFAAEEFLRLSILVLALSMCTEHPIICGRPAEQLEMSH